MAENGNCKAAGDFEKVEIVSPVNITESEKLKETDDKLLTVENGNVQCLLDKVDKQENCQNNKNNDEESVKNGKEEVNTENTSNSSPVSQLLLEVEARTKERDNYHNKLIEAEKKFDILEIEYNGILNGKEDESSLRQELKNLKIQMAQTQLKLDDRVRIVANQENQINALMSQVSSLKDVVNITKDLLNIRNMEVKHLQENVEAMEEKINLEREKHNTMLIKMESAFKINLDLKQEYETQLRLFQELREKYDKKVVLLSEENSRLENIEKQNKTI